MRSILFLQRTLFSPGLLQWAPTLDSHDPNPPITLESVVIGAMTGSTAMTFTPAGLLTGAGALAGTAAMAFTVSGTLIDRKLSLLYRPRSAQLMPLLHY